MAISTPRSAWACRGWRLLIVALVIMPLRDFQAADEGGNNGPLAMMLLRIWLFGLYLSSMESFFLDRADPLWFTFLLAVFGLHYLARFQRREGAVRRSRAAPARPSATSFHQPSKSNGKWTGGRLTAAAIRSA